MFKIKRIDDETEILTVYDTKHSEDGLILFLTFKNGLWHWVWAFDFVPVEE